MTIHLYIHTRYRKETSKDGRSGTPMRDTPLSGRTLSAPSRELIRSVFFSDWSAGRRVAAQCVPELIASPARSCEWFLTTYQARLQAAFEFFLIFSLWRWILIFPRYYPQTRRKCIFINSVYVHFVIPQMGKMFCVFLMLEKKDYLSPWVCKGGR